MGFFARLFRRKKKKPTLGLALGSGGAKGMAHLGALKAFEEHGLEFDVVAGTSIGAIVGALYVKGYSVADMWGIIESLNRKEFAKNLRPFSDLDFAERLLEGFIEGVRVLGDRRRDQRGRAARFGQGCAYRNGVRRDPAFFPRRGGGGTAALRRRVFQRDPRRHMQRHGRARRDRVRPFGVRPSRRRKKQIHAFRGNGGKRLHARAYDGRREIARISERGRHAAPEFIRLSRDRRLPRRDG